MARFKRVLNDRQRAAMIKRKQEMVAKVVAKPSVSVVMEASGGGNKARSDVKNTIIFRTHRKDGARLRFTAGDARKVLKNASVDALHKQLLGGDASALPRMLAAIGDKMASMLSDKVVAEGLVKTGQLLGAFGFKTAGKK